MCEEREETVEERTKPAEMEKGLKSLEDKYGMEKILGAVRAALRKKGESGG